MTERSLTCPGCAHPMRVETLSKVEIDRCTRCYGIWFDAGEVAKAALHAVPPLEEKSTSERKCPVCKTSLMVGRMDHVGVDHCDTCQGTFLDSGELEQLRAGSPGVAGEEAPSAQELKEGQTAQAMGMWALLAGSTGA